MGQAGQRSSGTAALPAGHDDERLGAALAAGRWLGRRRRRIPCPGRSFGVCGRARRLVGEKARGATRTSF